MAEIPTSFVNGIEIARTPAIKPNRIYLDIETLPLAEDELMKVAAPFDEDSVKVGNIKDPAKIAEKIEAAREAHKADILDKAALSATTAHVAVIGIIEDDHYTHYSLDPVESNEVIMLTKFWEDVDKWMLSQRQIITFNGHKFDLPFLIRRSWILGVKPNKFIRRGRYFADNFIDLMEVWSCGVYGETINLANLCKAMGAGEKLGKGKDFPAMWKEKRYVDALAYSEQDCRLLEKLAKRML